MRLTGSNKTLLAGLIVLATVSLGVKAAAGTTTDGTQVPGVENEVVDILNAQGFATGVNSVDITPIVLAQRGDCRLSVRNAQAGANISSFYAQEAKSIGPVRYLYHGEQFDAAPGPEIWLDHFANKMFATFRVERRVHVAIALASSPACRGQDFGLSDVRVPLVGG